MIRLTKAQFAQLVGQLESIIKHLKKQHALKGSGPDDYSFSQTLETYLYRHPMSMIEFWVDDGAVPMGGAGVRDWMKKKRKTLGGVMKRIASSLNRVKDEAKEEAEQMIKKKFEQGKQAAESAVGQGKEQLRDAANVAKEIADTSIKEAVEEVTAEIKGNGHSSCGCHKKQHHHHHLKGHGYGHAFAGERHHDKEKHHKDEHDQVHGGHFYNTKGQATSNKGKHSHVHETNPKKVRKMPPGLAGGARAGEFSETDGGGLNLGNMGFVQAIVPTTGQGISVPFSNHLMLEPVSGDSLQAPAGGFGDYALPVSGGAWETAY